MQKIASHIKNPTKFNKASKLAVQLIQVGSVKSGTSNEFFDILEAAIASPSVCNEPSLRMDFHQTLFSAVQDVAECFSKQQKNQLATWTLQAVVANDLYTDDSFVVINSTYALWTWHRNQDAYKESRKGDQIYIVRQPELCLMKKKVEERLLLKTEAIQLSYPYSPQP